MYYECTSPILHYRNENDVQELVAEFAYSLLPNGRRSGVAETLRQPDNSLASRTISYTYDNLNRLTQEASVPYSPDPLEAGISVLPEMDYQAAFTYDLAGNRIQKTETRNLNTETITYTHSPADQILTETSSLADIGTTVYGYNINGSLTSKTNATTGESATYGYNLSNRLSSASIQRTEEATDDTTVPVDIQASYVYNQNGIRVRADSAITANAVTTTRNRTHLIDPANPTGYAQVLEEAIANEHGNQTGHTTYILADDVLGQVAGSAAEWLLYDGHGSTRSLTNSTGTQLEQHSYDAYGELLGGNPNTEAPSDTNLLYSGEQFDPDLQQQYLRARYYDASLGIMNRVDPWRGLLRMPQFLNKYAYACQDPVGISDPSGLGPFSLTDVLTASFIHSTLSALSMSTISAATGGGGAPDGSILGMSFSMSSIGFSFGFLAGGSLSAYGLGMMVGSLLEEEALFSANTLGSAHIMLAASTWFATFVQSAFLNLSASATLPLTAPASLTIALERVACASSPAAASFVTISSSLGISGDPTAALGPKISLSLYSGLVWNMDDVDDYRAFPIPGIVANVSNWFMENSYFYVPQSNQWGMTTGISAIGKSANVLGGSAGVSISLGPIGRENGFNAVRDQLALAWPVPWNIWLLNKASRN